MTCEEIAAEYAENISLMQVRIDVLRDALAIEPNAEMRYKLRRRILVIEGMISDGRYAIHLMRR